MSERHPVPASVRLLAKSIGTGMVDLELGRVVLELPAPQSVNATAGQHRMRRHKRKRRLERELAYLLATAEVPEPIPGDHVTATAVLMFPPPHRHRDEDNYRAPLSKALGDALARPDESHPWRYLTNDTPAHFQFDRLEFVTREAAPRGGLARVALEWTVDRRAVLVVAPTRAWALAHRHEIDPGASGRAPRVVSSLGELEIATMGITAEHHRIVWLGDPHVRDAAGAERLLRVLQRLNVRGFEIDHAEGA